MVLIFRIRQRVIVGKYVFAKGDKMEDGGVLEYFLQRDKLYLQLFVIVLIVFLSYRWWLYRHYKVVLFLSLVAIGVAWVLGLRSI